MNEKFDGRNEIEIPIFMTEKWRREQEEKRKVEEERRLRKLNREKRIKILFIYSMVITVLFLVFLCISILKIRRLESDLSISEARLATHQKEFEEFYEFIMSKNEADDLDVVIETPEERFVESSKYDYPFEYIISTYTKEEIELLASCVFAEAGDQDLKGKRLVVDTILNRVDSTSGYFPDTIEEVIKQKNQFSTWPSAIKTATPSYSDYLAVFQELSVPKEKRVDDKVMYFTAGRYNSYGTPAYQYGDHYFSYE